MLMARAGLGWYGKSPPGTLQRSDFLIPRMQIVPDVRGQKMRWKIQVNRIYLSVAAAALLLAPIAGAEDLVGQASVIDGDTIEIHGTRIRLWGIDAPESTQLCRNDDSDLYQCGRSAANALAALFWNIKL
jgi:endonuclease YncB( thermonuclease family)